MQHTHPISSSCHEQLSVTVIAGNDKLLQVQPDRGQQSACNSCKHRQGCQSLSLYHWFFSQQTVTIAAPANAQPLTIGQQLKIDFPKSLLSSSIWRLLGWPLLGFIGGVSLTPLIGEPTAFVTAIGFAGIGFYMAQHRTRQLLSRSINIRVDKSAKQIEQRDNSTRSQTINIGRIHQPR